MAYVPKVGNPRPRPSVQFSYDKKITIIISIFQEKGSLRIEKEITLNRITENQRHSEGKKEKART